MELIARRTGKSVSYFTHGDLQTTCMPDLSSDLAATSKRLERLAGTMELSEADREAFRMVVSTLRHGARLIAARDARTQAAHRQRGPAAAPAPLVDDDANDAAAQQAQPRAEAPAR